MMKRVASIRLGSLSNASTNATKAPMKMENELRAPVDVIVEKIMVEETEQVDGMQVLMELSEKE